MKLVIDDYLTNLLTNRRHQSVHQFIQTILTSDDYYHKED